jgi:catechol 2,3-dioxygenase-like lactoylglutathione lyase family enzyme
MKTHISINVSDLEKSINFYERMFGTQPAKVKADYAKFDLTQPPLNFSLNQGNFERGGSVSHFGLQVNSTDDVLNITQRWNAEGLLTSEEMNTDCCYALQDKTWVKDPDGNSWEVFTVLADTEGVETDSTMCCVNSETSVSPCC